MSEQLERRLLRGLDEGDVIPSHVIQAADTLKRYREALERSAVAIDDWLNTYADDLCDANRVAEARARIAQFGTLAYIADVQQQNRQALSDS